MLGLMGLAAALRLYRLPDLPPGFHIDEAYNMFDALRIVSGERPVFLEANAGRDVLYSYFQAILVALLGSQVLSLRLTSALIGLATVGLTYGFVRGLRLPRLTAALTGLLLATTFWHLAFSRFGIRAVTLPLIEVLTFWFFWRGLRARRSLDFALSGLFLGLGAYTHPAGRLVPLIPLLFTIYLAIRRRADAMACLRGLALMALVAVIVFLPLGRYFWAHPWAFLGHPEEVSILSARVAPGESRAQVLATNAWRVLSMFTWQGDGAWWRNLARRPVFDPLMSLAFVVGIGLLLSLAFARKGAGAERDVAVFALLWLGIMLLPTWLTDQAPNFSRAIGVLPVALLPPAWALTAAWEWGAQRRGGWAAVGLATVVFLSTAWTVGDYFIVYARSPELYYAYDQDKVDIAAYLHRASAHDRVYVAPFLARHATVRFLTREVDLASFDIQQGLVLPPREGERGARYVFWARQPESAAEATLVGLAEKETVADAQGNPMLTVYRVPAQRLPTIEAPLAALPSDLGPLQPVGARFGEVVELVGFAVEGELTAGGKPTLTLVWRGLEPMERDYTVFVHVVDEGGKRWGQHDKPPLGGSYPTSVWAPGEIIIDHYTVSLAPDGPLGKCTWQVGLYRLETLERLPATTATGERWPEDAVRLAAGSE
ncbi:MAG: glycosyltransferase family 39 protein [Anaerolineae bacterium]